MDIVKRAYLKVKKDLEGDQDTWEMNARIRDEVIRLIKVRAYRAYNKRDWPEEFGPLPEELRKG